MSASFRCSARVLAELGIDIVSLDMVSIEASMACFSSIEHGSGCKPFASSAALAAAGTDADAAWGCLLPVQVELWGRFLPVRGEPLLDEPLLLIVGERACES